MPAPQSAKLTKGQIKAVPCPHCGAPNDFREMQEDFGATFEPGFKADCDTCGRHMVVAAVQTVTYVAVRQIEGQTQRMGARAAAAPPPKPGFFAALFGPPKR